MSLLWRFKIIQKFCPYTGCFSAADYICGAFVHCWTDQQMKDVSHYSNPDNIYSSQWKDIFPSIKIHFDYRENGVFSNHQDPLDIHHMITSYLDLYKIICVRLETDHLDHSFILFKCNEYYIIDAYGSKSTKRLPTIRMFNPTELGSFFQCPRISKWNRLFLCEEDTTKQIGKIHLSCDYLDIS